ncbi:MAG: aldose epimerase family protein [Novosphingobium sp.]
MRTDGGTLTDGTRVEAVTLSNGNGVSARILSYGATLQSLVVPDRHGKLEDIVLGHDRAQDYEATQDFFGVTVGRYANRIAGGRFTIDGQTFQLPLNNGKNSLHGGGKGFDRAVWRIVSVQDGSVVLEHVSPDGDSGYPGEVTARVTYSMDKRGALTIAFDATTTKPTVLNMTNHALFNLSGACPALGAMNVRMTIPASRFTPVNEALIPTGELRAVAGGPFDFTTGRNLGRALRSGNDPQIRIGRGYDHNFVLDKGQTRQPGLAARVEDPASGRVLEILTTEPGVQLYTGNFLDGTNLGKNGCVYRMGDGFALEPQKFPDTPNQPQFGSARVDPGKPYHHVMIIRTSITK